MARVHNALRYFRRVQQAYQAIVGSEDPDFTGIERAGETLTPVVNLWERPEWAFLRGEVLFNAYYSVNAVAAEMGFVGVRNPAASGLIVIVEKGRVHVNTAGIINMFHGAVAATDVDGSEQVAPADTRYNLAGTSAIVQIHGTGAAAVGNNALVSFRAFTGPTDPETRIPGPQVLTPGFELRIYNSTVNDIIRVQLQGRIVPAQPRELQRQA